MTDDPAAIARDLARQRAVDAAIAAIDAITYTDHPEPGTRNVEPGAAGAIVEVVSAEPAGEPCLPSCSIGYWLHTITDTAQHHDPGDEDGTR